jgi:putative ABC transport system ATP-binding protein
VYRFYHAGEEETLALRGVSFRVDLGEMVALLGPSGSGKSTLLACLAGLDEPDGGYVVLRGVRLTRRPEAERAARRTTEISMLLQGSNLLEHLSLEDNIALPMHLARSFDARRLAALLARLDLEERRRARPSELSGGEAPGWQSHWRARPRFCSPMSQQATWTRRRSAGYWTSSTSIGERVARW